ncbi:MAG: ABC transporter ATP-binding protein, partial [Thermoanaerobaculia bacterium]|nr:ABC transporter ATP-binding protein [Thermoanaerobaculia bacterium]
LQVSKVPETLRVREHIELFSSYYDAPQPLGQCLSVAGLDGLEERRYGELSGGQQQRLLFALAFCGNPDLLILDEPTVGLDVESRRGMWREIRRFVAAGGTVPLTTHYLEEADALADRIVVMHQGSVLSQGTPAEIKAQAAGRRIRCLSKLVVQDVELLPSVLRARRDGASLEILASDGDAAVRQLMTLDPNLSALEVSNAGLEEAFLSLTEAASQAMVNQASQPGSRPTQGDTP